MSHVAGSWRDFTCRRDGHPYLERCIAFLEHRLPYMRGQAGRFERAARLLSEQFGMGADERFALSIAAQFHDIGMLAVPESLLLRAGGLAVQERSHVALHAGIGGRLVAKVYPDLPEAIEAIWYHHERYDGRGPHGLTGDLTPRLAAIIAVLAATDAMLNGRPYQPARPPSATLNELVAGSQTQFDPRVVRAVLQTPAPLFRALLLEPQREAPPAPAPTEPQGAAPALQGVPPRLRAPVRMAVGSLKPLKRRDEVLGCITGQVELRPLAPIVQTVMSLTASAQCTAGDVARELMRDQALSIRLLKMANSSAYKRGRHVTGIKEAVGRVGLQQVRQLVMTLSVMSRYQDVMQERLDPKLFWEHCIACGLIGSAVARELSIPNPEEFFVYGMLHDVGRLLLMEAMPQEYAVVWDAARRNDLPLDAVERRVLCLSHAMVLGEALRLWRFPQEFIVPIVHHHDPIDKLRRLGSGQAEPAAIVALGNRLAQALLLGTSGGGLVEPVDDLCAMLGLPEEAIVRICERVPEQTTELKFAMLAHGHAEAWPDAAASVRGVLCRPLRAIAVGARAATDAFLRFLGRIVAQDADVPPELAVVHSNDEAELPGLHEQLRRAEEQRGLSALPALILAPHDMPAGHALTLGRPHVHLRVPVSVERLAETLNWMLKSLPEQT